MYKYANPNQFMKLSKVLLPWTAVVAVLTTLAGIWYALIDSPPDYQQGETVRIMYLHVPAAWMSLFCYVVMAVSAGVGAIWKHPVGDVAAKATAPIGAAFTLITLITGSFWGKPMWGVWWVWDARLTAELVLLFLYLGYMALIYAFDDPTRGMKAGAVLALVGIINVPIIKFSVDWWNTMHQPASVVKMGGPAIDGSMLIPLFIMAVAFKAYYVFVLLLRMRAEITASKVRALRLRQVHG
ncbi:heme ABC transporter permease [Magnetospira thiophila]